MATSYIEARLELERVVFEATEALETLRDANLVNKTAHARRRAIAENAGHELSLCWLNRDEVTP